LLEERRGVMISNVESVSYRERDADETRSVGTERQSVKAAAPACVRELTAGQLELQRRLVRESLLLRAA
jgi:hypothetical protein